MRTRDEMSRNFTYYWDKDEFARNAAAISAGQRPTLGYATGSGFIADGLKQGDYLYILNWSMG